jgi:hypothetical protein
MAGMPRSLMHFDMSSDRTLPKICARCDAIKCIHRYGSDIQMAMDWTQTAGPIQKKIFLFLCDYRCQSEPIHDRWVPVAALFTYEISI